MLLHATAKASATGTQGAGIWPELTDTGTFIPAASPGTDKVPPFVAALAQQVVAAPLANTNVEGYAIFYVFAGRQYRIDYCVRAGTGGTTVTFNTLAMTINGA